MTEGFRRSRIRASLSALVVSIALALPAWADNGLQRFEREIRPQLDVQKLTYRAGAPAGDSGFVLDDVTVVTPPRAPTQNRPGTFHIDRLTVDALDFDHLRKESRNEWPRVVKLQVEGLTGDAAASSMLTAYGFPKVPIDIVVDWTFDRAAMKARMNRLEISMRGEGRISAVLAIAGLSDIASARQNVALEKGTIVIDDKGLLAKVLQTFGSSRGNSADGLVALSLITLSGLAQQQPPQTLPALDAIASFLTDWRAPKGPLTIGLQGPRGTNIDGLGALFEKDALYKILGLTANYADTRPGSALAGPPLK
ncbi:MAG: hypothetical protein JSR47_02885 [Proteobacteria bacterium]|nr:hypothetical protein [Pseudomonadota bacterium]